MKTVLRVALCAALLIGCTSSSSQIADLVILPPYCFGTVIHDGWLRQKAFLGHQSGCGYMIAKHLNPLIFRRPSYVGLKFRNAADADYQVRKFMQQTKGTPRQRVFSIHANYGKFFGCYRKA